MVKRIVGMRYMCWLYQHIKRPFVNLTIVIRKKMNLGKYQYLKLYKDKHKGKRCFILCTGPSLNYEDIHMLNNEITFGMNSLCLGFNNDSWRPTYFGIQDSKVFESVKKALFAEKDLPIFCSSQLKKMCKDVPDSWNIFPYNGIYNSYELKFKKEMKVKFSDDISSVVYDGYSITYSLIQIAAYMGFSEIYLLGADCNYIPGRKNHFIEHGIEDSAERQLLARDLLQFSYKQAGEELERKNIKIFNATRGGCLEVFKRINLEEISGLNLNKS